MKLSKKIIFITGTRADFGKLKPLIFKLDSDPAFEVYVFVTGMHMISKYGFTFDEVRKSGIKNYYPFSNASLPSRMDKVLSLTISGLSEYVASIGPDMLIVHGDRVEALAGASVGALNNIFVGHVEGGEVSGTVDELIRHAVSKLSHIHFVANIQAKSRLIQLGEDSNSIYVIGSPDIDAMNSKNIPTLHAIKKHYNFRYDKYSILLFHPVTTELDTMAKELEILTNYLIELNKNFVVIYPNNDHGSDEIIEFYIRKFSNRKNFRVIPSMRFEYFLGLLKNAELIIGNSSAGIREAPYYGVPTINLGTRQNNRSACKSIINAVITKDALESAFSMVGRTPVSIKNMFGDGDAASKFYKIISTNSFWEKSKQKYFIDVIQD